MPKYMFQNIITQVTNIQVAVWLSGNVLVSINVSYSTLGPVSTWMGDHFIFTQATQVNSAFRASGT